MSNNKNKYYSKYSATPNKEITFAQYINELICEHKASFDKQVLPIQFWKIPRWSNFYRKNLRQISKLLKQFDSQAILNVIQSKPWQNSYSIFTERFLNMVEAEQQKINTKTSVSNTVINRSTNSVPRSKQTPINLIDILKQAEKNDK